MINEEKDLLFSVGKQFCLQGDIVDIINYGDGHINTTYKMISRNKDKEYNYILQKINTTIFTEPQQLMDNIKNVTHFLVKKKEEGYVEKDYKVLSLVDTLEGDSFYTDPDGMCWRVYDFVENSIGYTFTDSLDVLYEAGKAIGSFQMLLADYPTASLHETIKDFHNTSLRYEQLMEAVEEDKKSRVKEVLYELKFCEKMKPYNNKLIKALETGLIPYRVTHNDTKLNNVLMDTETGKASCVIDLDTVMPGSCLFDYGDSIRSSCSEAEEDERDTNLVFMNMERYKAYTRGYLDTFGALMNEAELVLMPYACILMTFECGTRFLADYINGDVYFRIHRPEHNLDRARNQFKLVQDMLDQLEDMKKIIKEIVIDIL